MVKVCDTSYPPDTPYNDIFKQYPFSLSDFQKYGLQAIEEDKHILITAHTGSGKTLPAEYAIKHFCKKGKKVIYTAPIKSLSNQKFHEFSKKYPDISFGILTGDIKFNPEADCLIMTTEILRNTLFQQKMIDEEIVSKEQLSLHFNIDIQQDLGCVIFDEIHYINDRDRGKVWEETIMMLPKHILLVMLSATMDKAEKFASWIEEVTQKEVWWAPTTQRVVPLTHYAFLTLRSSLSNQHANTLMDTHLHSPLLLKRHHDKFEDKNYHDLAKIKHYFQKNRIFVNHSFVLNTIVKYLHEHNLLPAICFVFSRRKTEEYARQISLSLNDAKTMNIIENECKQILIKKLPNYKEYITLPEYVFMMKLLVKGIAVHHSGILPVLREMIEMLFDKGYIKLLFATETFAVGVNMPTKTVMFTGLQKFDGQGFRYLLPHEYTQMAGRAGRRGIDTKGTVIHLNNLFQYPPIQEYRTLLCGSPQRLDSKFQIHFNLILRLLSTQQDLGTFICQSMLQKNIEAECSHMFAIQQKIQEEIERKEKLLEYIQTPLPMLEEYYGLEKELSMSSRKIYKTKKKRMREIQSEYKHLEKDILLIREIHKKKDELSKEEKHISSAQSYIKNTIDLILDILYDYGFIDKDKNLTEKGVLATNIQEVHCLVFGELLFNKQMNYFEVSELACIFSCFTNVSIPREKRLPNVSSVRISTDTKAIIQTIQDNYNEIADIELKYNIYSGTNDEIQYELCELIFDWCQANNDIECKAVFQRAKERNISLGEFIKAILKINNIANELEKVCTIQANIELLDKIKKIPLLTLKSIATNQSLYL